MHAHVRRRVRPTYACVCTGQEAVAAHRLAVGDYARVIAVCAQREVNQLWHATGRRIDGLPEVCALGPLPPLPVGKRLGMCVPPRTLVIVVRDDDGVTGLLEGAPGSGWGGSG